MSAEEIPPSAVDSLTQQDEARRLIREGEWSEEGKSRSIVADDSAVAKAIQRELQRHVSGQTPGLRDAGSGVEVTTTKLVLGEAQKQLSKQVGA